MIDVRALSCLHHVALLCRCGELVAKGGDHEANATAW